MTELLALLALVPAVHPIGTVLGLVLLRALCVVYPPAPGLPIDLLAIGLFGPVLGFAWAEVGIMLGATVAFALGHRVGNSIRHSTLRTRLSVLADRVKRSVDDEDEVRQFYWWFGVRLLTNPLFDPMSYAAGLSRAQFRPFFFGTLLGNIPSIGLFFVAEYYAIKAGFPATIVVTVLFGLTIWYPAGRWLTEPESRVNV